MLLGTLTHLPLQAQDSSENPYLAIVQRNAFGLKEKPTPPPKNEEKKPDTKAEDLNIVVSGFGARGGKRMVFFKVPNEEKKGKYNFYTVDVDSTDANPIDVVKLDEEFITIRYKGGTHTLELASVQNKASKQAPKTAAKSPQPGGPNVAGGRVPTPSNIAGRAPSNPTMAGASSGNQVNGGQMAGNIASYNNMAGASLDRTQSLPTRTVRLGQNQGLDPATQAAIMEANRIIAEQQGIPMPPTPGLPETTISGDGF